MKSNAEDAPLLLATDEVLVNLHPMMCLPCADAVAMTTVTIGEKRKKRFPQKQLAFCNGVNSCFMRSCFAAVFRLIKACSTSNDC